MTDQARRPADGQAPPGDGMPPWSDAVVRQRSCRSTTRLAPPTREASTTSWRPSREVWPPRWWATGAPGPEWSRANCPSGKPSSSRSTPVQECWTGHGGEPQDFGHWSRRRAPSRCGQTSWTSCASDRVGTGSSRSWAPERRPACSSRGVGGRPGGIIPGPIPRSGSTRSAHCWKRVARATHADRETSTGVPQAIAASGLFLPPRRHIVAWERRVTVEDWLVDLRSHSYVIDLGEPEATGLIADVESILRATSRTAR